MSRFFVGQMVRIVSCFNPVMTHMVGREGRIIDVGNFPDHWVIDSARFTKNGVECSWASHRLAPATDANDKINWSECIWKPQHLRSRVEA